MLSSDIGSMPSEAKSELIWSGSRKANSLIPYLGVNNREYQVFKEEVTTAFVDKIKMGVDIPNYPQFRDMNEMFFDLMEGVEKTSSGLVAIKSLKARHGFSIPEVKVIKNESNTIRDETGVDKVKLRICVTGPYTLASFFLSKSPKLYEELAHTLSEILGESLFNVKGAETSHVCIDEPVLGFMNDPLLDYGSQGRESLRDAWEEICRMAVLNGCDTSMHLHNTSESLMWEVEHLGTIASHVGDPMYTQESTKQRLEQWDKQLWAAVGVTQFDNLIYLYYSAQGFQGNFPEKIGEVWTAIRKGVIDPSIFLEGKNLMRKRLEKVVDFVGAERVAYSSPECGLNSFPNYGLALECLRRASQAVKDFNESQTK
jgi:5-methyltetrahydropteroyltriglutamate--homocysteine methyltransferase